MPLPKTPAFTLNPSLNADELAARFVASGRIEIRDFLTPPIAASLRTHLLERSDWRLVTKAGDKVYELPRSGMQQLTAEQRQTFDERVFAVARNGFQFRYETIRVADDEGSRAARGTMLDDFVAFMSSAPVLAFLGKVIGTDDLVFADGQATLYSEGHFLTRHDDDVEGKHRRAAYVLGLQPDWSADWGGLLMFLGADGNVEEAYTPAMGALRLFRVPAPHCVSYVNPIAPESRLSVTGWLRIRKP